MSDRQKALDTALLQIEKQYGKGSIMKLGEASAAQGIEVIPTGSLALDIALGVGGIPRGRIVEIYGPESSGKTTLTLHIMAEAQKAGGVAAMIDAEHALDPMYARKLGVDIDNLLISQPDHAEQALEIAGTWCGAVLWMLWSLTLWPPWCLGRRLKVRWAMPMWAFRLA